MNEYPEPVTATTPDPRRPSTQDSVTSASPGFGTTDRTLPPADHMYQAVVARDTRFDGIFFTAVTTTGIFCRPSCPARKPRRENIEFYATAGEALALGFRPCRRCRPLEPPGQTPRLVRELLAEVTKDPTQRLGDRELRARGLDPSRIRRWFKRHYGMTFHAYQRALRVGKAIVELGQGIPIARAAYDNGYESLSGFQQALRRLTGGSPSRSRGVRTVRLSRVLTPLGPMLLGATETGVCLLEFTDRRMLETQLLRLARRLECVFVPGSNEVARLLEAELEQYFAGTLRTFRTPLDSSGTEFQRRAWTALREIPYGQTRSYSDQARTIGEPNAVRAVARSNGDNRIAIVIPCHRVVGRNGELTGYGGGLWRKRFLLDHERQNLV